jgi:ribosomal protein S6--L-glutamate ligase
MGRGVELLDDPAVAAAAFADAQRAGRVIYLQKMLSQRGEDVRLFVLGGEVIAAMRRTGACGDWRSNIALGGRGAAMGLDPTLVDLAVHAAAACGAVVAGVDLLIDDDGRPFVIELNAAPGWRELSRVTGVDVATEVVRYVEGVLGTEAGRHVA